MERMIIAELDWIMKAEPTILFAKAADKTVADVLQTWFTFANDEVMNGSFWFNENFLSDVAHIDVLKDPLEQSLNHGARIPH